PESEEPEDDRRRSRRRKGGYRGIASPEAPGWPGRIARSLDRTLARWEAGGIETAVDDLLRGGVPKTRARALAARLLEEGKGEAIRTRRTFEVFAGSPPEELLKVLLDQATIQVQGETDAPVTTDIHRLIRLPGSLHGGTGFRVVPLDRDRLDRFDPFREALP